MATPSSYLCMKTYSTMLLRELHSGIENSPDDYAHDIVQADKIYAAKRRNITAFWGSNNVNEYFNVTFYIDGKRYRYQIDRYNNSIPISYKKLQIYVDKLIKGREYEKLLQYLHSLHLTYSTY